jgi:hypothetical protein
MVTRDHRKRGNGDNAGRIPAVIALHVHTELGREDAFLVVVVDGRFAVGAPT